MQATISRKYLAVSLFSAFVLMAAAGADSTPEINNPADIAAIRQIGTVMGDAMVASDVEKLKQIYAEDWMSVSMSGEKLTRQDVLDGIKNGKHKLVSYELGPIDVQVLGNVAVAGGRVFETRMRDGKEVRMNVVYMDYLEKRGGKWLVVRSEGGAAK